MGEDEVPALAVAVRERSKERMRALGLPADPPLPFVDEPLLRDEEEVVGRALVLNAVLAVVYGLDRERAVRWVAEENLEGLLSPLEAGLLEGRLRPPWAGRVECLWAFLWALGMTPELDPCRQLDDDMVKLLPSLRVGESSHGFRERARLRPAEELYAEADAYYLLSWAARQSGLNSEPTPLLEQAVFARRRALDWILDEEVDWDDMSLDT